VIFICFFFRFRVAVAVYITGFEWKLIDLTIEWRSVDIELQLDYNKDDTVI
jgi:hypothetical protein